MHTKAQDIKRKKILAKGLTRADALRLFPWSKSMGDCRAFSYNPKTGYAVWT